MAFAVLIAILMGIGQLGLRRMHEINETFVDITGRRSTKLQLAREALKFSNRNSRITMEIFLVKDRALIETLLAAKSENSKEISEWVAEIGSRCESGKEKQLLAAVEGARQPYIESYARALHLLVDEENRDAASAVMVNETMPALLKYHAAWDEFVEFQKSQVDIAAQQAKVDYARTHRLASLLIVVAVAIALAIALFATRETVREIAARIEAQKQISELNADLELRVKQRTGELTDANKQLAGEAQERRRTGEELRDGEDKLRLILESTAEAIYGVDLEGRCTFCNPACLRLLGYKHSDELLGRNLHDLIHHSRRDGTKIPVAECRILRAFKSEQGIHVDDEVLWKADETSFPVEYWSYPQRKGEDIVGAVVAFVDITERKVAEERIRSLAYYDALTGLPNRILLQDRLTQAMASASRRQEKVALLFLDLDRFKDTNDSRGHSVGDDLLKEVAERLKRQIRDTDTVSRLGGDEFVVVLTQVKHMADSAVTASRIMSAMKSGFVIQGHSLSVSCSLGISIFPEHGTDVETLIKNADAAMYCAKDNGRASFRFFTEEMNAQVVERLALESGLRQALDKKELFLVYQPQMDIATGRITGLEALLRWQHPELGLVPPDRFIRIAENSGLIIPIGEWVLRTACSRVREWQDEGLPALPVAVNVSAVQFRQEGFCELIRRVLHETGVAPHHLELELTESLLLSNADVTFSVLRELKAMGLKLAIDDFGTGYSSLSYLKQFPVSKLKIDRSFVRDVAVNADDAAITTAIISMAKSLNLKVIAEGVENEAQMSFLRAHQCDEIQGYYFSKPLSAAEVVDKLRGTAVQHALSANHGAGLSGQSHTEVTTGHDTHPLEFCGSN
jgi:diguanylate cyclase (GGDEF)-like protein/PAS domain S-box-containing protein